MTIGKIIKEEREKLNISSENLADRSNLSVIQLYRIENDLVKPRLSTLKLIANSLKINYTVLIGDYLQENCDDADKIKNARITLGLTQAKFAKFCNVSLSTIQFIEQKRDLEKHSRTILKILSFLTSNYSLYN